MPAVRIAHAALAAWLLAGGPPPQTQQPRPPIEVFTDAVRTEPATFGAQVADADAIVHCRIDASRVRALERDDEGTRGKAPGDLSHVPDVSTIGTARVLEVLKDHPPLQGPGSMFDVTQPLGQATWNGRTVVHRQGEVTALRLGEEYVLFLHWNPVLREFGVDPSDTYLIRNGRVTSAVNTAVANAQRARRSTRSSRRSGRR
jgi:hypothetical protein